MAQRQPRRQSGTPTDRTRPSREPRGHSWNELLTRDRTPQFQTNLVQMIEQDAPLQSHSTLVLMYGPFQAEMQAGKGEGVASWIQDCIRKHGLPSLVRFDHRHRAQIFRRDQFQPWLEPILAKIPS